jgi:hypothetical protein
MTGTVRVLKSLAFTFGVGSLLFVCLVAALFFVWRSCGTPPSDATVVRRFYSHRSDFEKLRMMLQEDGNIINVASYGVNTTNFSVFAQLPEQAGLHKERYQEYLTTMARAGVSIVGHNHGEFFFLIERWGFAGEGWGIAVISRDTAPTNLIASLDDFRNSTYRFAYRHLEGGWYLWIQAS